MTDTDDYGNAHRPGMVCPRCSKLAGYAVAHDDPSPPSPGRVYRAGKCTGCDRVRLVNDDSGLCKECES